MLEQLWGSPDTRIVVLRQNEPIALALAVVVTAAVVIAVWEVVAAAPVVVPVVKTTIATAIAATEILHMLVLIESLTKCMDMAAGYVSHDHAHRMNNPMMTPRAKRLNVLAKPREIVTTNHTVVEMT